MEMTGLHRNPVTRVTASLLLAAVLGAAPPIMAETVYKSVDADGRVTYSSEPPEKAVESKAVTLPPGPSEAERKDAIKREKELQKAADRITGERAAAGSGRTKAVTDAQKELDEAQQRLEEAKVMHDSDWQGKAGGGRRLKESYFERVERAEERVRQAEDESAKARRDVR